MSNLSDYIEDYLKELIHSSNQGSIDIQRNELAEKFRCAPSQINYVLTTRFTFERGYLVESRRGGGGYVRVVRVSAAGNDEYWLEFIGDTIGEALSHLEAAGIIQRLWEDDFLTKREMLILTALTDRRVLKGSLPDRDYLRARLLKTALLTILRGE